MLLFYLKCIQGHYVQATFGFKVNTFKSTNQILDKKKKSFGAKFWYF